MSSSSNEILSQLPSTLVYARTANISELADDLASLRSFDKEHEQLQAKGKKTGCLGVLLVLVGAPMTVIGLGGAAGEPALIAVAALGAVLAIAGFVVGVVGFASNRKHARLNLDNRRYETLAGILRLVSADIDNDAPVSAKVDFGSHNARKNYVRDGRSGHWKVKYYANCWFQLGGRLLDGAKFDLSLTEKHQDRSRTKRSASGKTKYKTKTKSSGEAMLRLRVKEKRYPNLPELTQSVNAAIRLPEGAQLKSVSAEGQALAVTVRFGSYANPRANPEGQAQRRVEIMAAMMLSLYQVLNRSR